MGDINKESVARAYARWAPVYDAVFGKVFAPGRAAAIEATEKHCGAQGGRVLEVGVGTGLSLPAYSTVNRITGIDISKPMLRQAAERVAMHGLKNVETLSVMDAARLALSDESFDVVIAQFVITTVPDPEGALDEFVRVLKRNGEIILVNHIGADAGPRWLFEQCFAPIARQLGWRPEFPFQRLTDWAQRHGGVRLIERRPMPPLGHFSLIRFARTA